jgi:hypothetical protein
MADNSHASAMDPAQHLLQIAAGYVLSSALQVVTKAGVADELANGPRTTSDLSAITNTDEKALYRLLRALAAVGIFEETATRTFRLTPPADLLRKNHPQSLHDLVIFFADPLHLQVYANLIESLRTGGTAVEKTLGMPVFEYFRQNREYSEVFNNAMTNLSAAVIPAALEAYSFEGIHTLVDIAGGHGEVLLSILKKYPGMRGILMDLEHVIAGAKQRLASAGVQSRVEAVAGDFFKAVPAGGDAYIMKHIIHDWDDDHAAIILSNVRKAIGSKNGKLILLEAVLAPGNAPDFGKVMDIEMLALPGGRERTKEEFEVLFRRAGFALTSVAPTKSPVCVIEGVPQ